MSRIYIPTNGVADWKARLADPKKQWRTGYSALASAHAWEDAAGLPPEIAALFDPGAALLLAIPEHKVAMPGRGSASQCDVFALLGGASPMTAVAIEAKVRESFGPSLKEWLAQGRDGRQVRLAGICDILGLHNPDLSLRYQLFHRTAAAVLEARRFGAHHAAMIVHSFAQDHMNFDDFAAFCQAMGARAQLDGSDQITLPGGITLRLGCATGDPRFLAVDENV
jgi:hypothetical protein